MSFFVVFCRIRTYDTIRKENFVEIVIISTTKKTIIDSIIVDISSNLVRN